jgi:hypothetical protein
MTKTWKIMTEHTYISHYKAHSALQLSRGFKMFVHVKADTYIYMYIYKRNFHKFLSSNETQWSSHQDIQSTACSFLHSISHELRIY